MKSLFGTPEIAPDRSSASASSSGGGRSPVKEGDDPRLVWALTEGLRPKPSPQRESACSSLGWPADTLKNFTTVEVPDRNGDLRQVRIYDGSPYPARDQMEVLPQNVGPQQVRTDGRSGAGDTDEPMIEFAPLNNAWAMRKAVRFAAEVAANVGLPAVFADGSGRVFVGRVCDEQRGRIEVSYQIQYLNEAVRPPQPLERPKIIRSGDPQFQPPSTGQEVQL
jgi:hypothetical protein